MAAHDGGRPRQVLLHSRKEDWCRIVLSMSDGSSRAGNLLCMYKSLMAIFTQCLTDILLTNIYIILFHESRHFYHITIEWGRLYCIDTSVSQHLIKDTKHNKYVVGPIIKPSRP